MFLYFNLKMKAIIIIEINEDDLIDSFCNEIKNCTLESCIEEKMNTMIDSGIIFRSVILEDSFTKEINNLKLFR